MKVFVALYDSRCGSVFRVFNNIESAYALRRQIALDEWYEGAPMPEDPDEAADQFWDTNHREEWFYIEECEIEN